MRKYPEVTATLTRSELAAPFAMSTEAERIEGPTRLHLVIEETADGIVFAETDPETDYTVTIGELLSAA